MEFFNKTIKKFAKKASIAVTESVKIEAKKTAISILPTVLGVGGVIAGFVIFKNSLSRPASAAISSVASAVPALSRTSIVTNNYFFDPSIQSEIVSKLINQ